MGILWCGYDGAETQAIYATGAVGRNCSRRVMRRRTTRGHGSLIQHAKGREVFHEVPILVGVAARVCPGRSSDCSTERLQKAWGWRSREGGMKQALPLFILSNSDIRLLPVPEDVR
jgi:hypothetical protein